MIVGQPQRGATPVNLAADVVRGIDVTVPSPAHLSHLALLLDGLGPGVGAALVRGVVFGDDGQLIARGDEVRIEDGAAAQWVQLPMGAAAGTLLAAGDYRVGVHVGGPASCARAHVDDPGASGSWSFADSYSDGTASLPAGPGTAFTVGTAAANSSAAGPLRATVRLVGGASSTSGASASLSTSGAAMMTGAASASAGASGTLTAGTAPAITEGFESNDLANWVVNKSVGETVTVTAAAARSGAYGCRIVKSLAGAAAYARWPIIATNDTGDAKISGYFRYRSDSGSSSNNGTGIRIFAGGVRIVDVFRQDSTGEIAVRHRRANGTFGFVNPGLFVGLNTWVKYELRAVYNGAGAVSRIVLKVNGTLAFDNSTYDLASGGFDEIQIGSEHTTQVVDLDVDDLVLEPPRYVGTTYYVDPAGSNAAAGTSQGTAWQTVGKVNGFALQPGDIVLFKRGGTWTDAGLNITASGTAARRIRIGAYGTGARPILDGGGNFANGSPLNPTPGPWPTMGTRYPVTLTGNWIVIEEVTVQQSSWGGLRAVGDDNIARRFTARWNVAGVHTLAGGDRFEAHDYELIDNSVMSVNAPGSGGAAIDDSGAFGHAIFGADGYFHDATSTGHRATSYDFGVDGSCIELYGGKRNRFSRIVSIDDEAFSELGHADTEDTSYDHCLYYSLAGDGRIGLNVQGALFGSPLRTKMEHCTIYLPAGSGNSGIVFNTIPSWAASTAYSVGARIVPSLTNAKANGRVYEVTVAGTTGATEPTWPTVTGNTVTSGGVTFIDRGLQGEFYNNIVVASWKNGFTGGPIAENNNLYFDHSTPQIRSTFHATPAASDAIGPQSKTGQNPLFVNTATPDLRLQAGSPALNAGVNRGYVVDLDGLPRLVGAAPDMGAYERQT